jgi:predicted dehydrogenase
MSRIPVAVVGFGHWSAKLVRVFAASPHFVLVAISDVDPARQRCASEIYPGVAVLRDIDSVLELPDVAAVAIATPPLSLFSLARQAIAAERHVFVEKPCAAATEEALALAEAAESARRVVFVDLTPVWSPLQDELAAKLASGAAGQLVSWRAERINCGYGQPGIDVLRDLAVHDLAVLDALVPARPNDITLADAIYGADGRLVSARMQLTYDDGMVADIVASWIGKFQRRRTTIMGTKGTLLRDDVNKANGLGFRAHLGRFGSAVAPTAVHSLATSLEPLARAVQAFGECILSGAPARTDAFAAARVLGWIAAAEQADREPAPAADATGRLS